MNNRIYRFRAWDKINKRMCRVKRIEWGIDDNFVVWIEWDEKDEHKEELRNSSRVDIMQYTGIKDKNGKEIYEGDIVKCRDYYGARISDVRWSKEYGVFYCIKKHEHGCGRDSGKPLFITSRLTEVIGNVYENEELLKNKEAI